MLIPFAYNLRSLLVRRTATLLTVLGIAATVAVLAGVLALQNGFESLFKGSGRDDVAVFLRPGATSEGESYFTRANALRLVKSVPEVALDGEGQPLAAVEVYLAVRRFKVDGGETNVPIRGVQPASFAIARTLAVSEGRAFRPGTDEVIVGRKLVGRIRDCALGDVVQLNTTPFRVVGVFDHDGPFSSEIWGDMDRMLDALQRPAPSRVVAQLRPDASVAALAERLASSPDVPAKVLTERAYFAAMTERLSATLLFLGALLGAIMGVAAVFTATNTMLAALAARTHEIGILLSLGFRPGPIFLAFLLESLAIGLLGGLAGAAMTVPLHGAETGTMNFNTFTEVAFAFRVTPRVLATAVGFSLLLGLLGGAWPAWRAARMRPTEALRRV